MDTTERHSFQLVMPSQAQKHVTVNESFTLLDGLVHLAFDQLGVDDPETVGAAPATVTVGEMPVGLFAGEAGRIGFLTLAGWRFATPLDGMLAFDRPAGRVVVFREGEGWLPAAGFIGLDRLEALGIGTDADATNRLAVKSDAVLMTARAAADGGSGDLRLVLNRESDADVVSLLMQSGYSGRVEFGIPAGGDAFRIKVSPDGADWTDAFEIEGDGSIRMSEAETFSGGKIWTADNDGPSSGLDADRLDGQEGDFYRNAGSLNAGTLAAALLPKAAYPDTPAIDGTVDLNTLTSAGWQANVYGPMNANIPEGGRYFHVLVLRLGPGTLTQVAFPYGHTMVSQGANAGVFLRGLFSGAWTAWNRLSAEARADGRYVAASAYTAADVLAKILTVDGSGSGICADRIDPFAVSALPSAITRGLGAVAVVSDGAPPYPVYSDGADWRRFSDGSVV